MGIGLYFSAYYICLSIFLAFAASYPDMEVLAVFCDTAEGEMAGLDRCSLSGVQYRAAGICRSTSGDHSVAFKFCPVLFFQQEAEAVFAERASA